MERRDQEHEDTGAVEANPIQKKKAQPAKGKRYAPGLKKEILEYADKHSVAEAAKEFDATETIIYEWRRAIKRRAEQGAEKPGEGPF